MTTDIIDAEQAARRQRKIERMTPAIQTVRDYVARIVANETSEPEELAELDDALEVLKMPPEKLPLLVAAQRWYESQRDYFEKEGSTDVSAELQAKRLACKRSAEELAEKLRQTNLQMRELDAQMCARGPTKAAIQAKLAEHPILFGTIQQAIESFFPGVKS